MRNDKDPDADSALSKTFGMRVRTGVFELPLSMAFHQRQLLEYLGISAILEWLEVQLDKERDQLALWTPVALGLGITMWFLLADWRQWCGFLAGCGGMALCVKRAGRRTRLARVLVAFPMLMALGCVLIWMRSVTVAEPVPERPLVATFTAAVERSEVVLARDQVRLTLRSIGQSPVPPRVRVNVPLAKMPASLPTGSVIKLRARLMPPAMAALPGAYDFSRRAWFLGLGATGQLLGDVEIMHRARPFLAWDQHRQNLSRHVQQQMAGGAGAIGATLATGDRGGIDEADAEAMRRSGLAHLLSISGLHVTAVVGATYLLVLRVLALVPAWALRVRLPLIAAGCAAVAALGYTLLTGAQVPTIRACVAALLVLTALLLGRSAITLRMVAAGAIFVLLLWPESLFGPSFQLSFAAVTAIIALHEHPRIKSLFARREERFSKRLWRFLFALFLTGLMVELVLMPIALFHFHKAGVYGALANVIAIPLTTFVIMPLIALALAFDSMGWGGPLWIICDQALSSLLWLAHFVSSRPGSVTLISTMAHSAFGLMIGGGLWLALWRGSWRIWGLVPVVAGATMIAGSRPPDLYITGDGRHVGIRTPAGELAMLRNRSGDFIRDMILENAAIAKAATPLEDWPNADCNADSCTIRVRDRRGRYWIILATRSRYYIPALSLSAACQRADIVISERRLPASCQPRWFKADRVLLEQTGGMTVNLSKKQVLTVLQRTGRHHWIRLKPHNANSASGSNVKSGEAGRDSAKAP